MAVIRTVVHPAEGFGLGGQTRPIRLARDKVALAEFVAVEQGDHVREVLVRDEIHRLPDLTLARFAVANDAIDDLVDAIEAGRAAESAGDGETLAKDPVAASKKGKPSAGFG